MKLYVPSWAHKGVRLEVAGIVCATLSVMLGVAAFILWTAPTGKRI